MQAKGNSPFKDAVQHSEITIVDSSINYVSNRETFNYQPFGPLDVVTKMEVSMNLNLIKKAMVRLRKSYYFYIINCNKLT